MAASATHTVGGHPGPFGVKGFVCTMCSPWPCHLPTVTEMRRRAVASSGTRMATNTVGNRRTTSCVRFRQRSLTHAAVETRRGVNGDLAKTDAGSAILTPS